MKILVTNEFPTRCPICSESTVQDKKLPSVFHGGLTFGTIYRDHAVVNHITQLPVTMKWIVCMTGTLSLRPVEV